MARSRTTIERPPRTISKTKLIKLSQACELVKLKLRDSLRAGFAGIQEMVRLKAFRAEVVKRMGSAKRLYLDRVAKGKVMIGAYKSFKQRWRRYQV